jgi:hypothetical protein
MDVTAVIAAVPSGHRPPHFGADGSAVYSDLFVSAARHHTLQERIEERRPILDSLLGDFSRFVRRFAANQQFVGPSIYFHVKTIQALAHHSSAVDTLGDDTFFDFLYATLASWGLHRMGPGNAKLRDLQDLKASFRAQAPEIERLQQLQIERLDASEVHDVADATWKIMANLRVGIGETLLVTNSKALHHLLPGLVPPIDHNYTLRFFVGRPYIYRGRDADYFRAIYPLFHEVAVRCAGEIHEFTTRPYEGMNTSVTKVIDNAILGYMATMRDQASR